mmetsp:Transcript_34092/g.62848  ORF Transcript_34092/g.62848 Transcript_34092/m.62848 type:complete len:120 (+) Transcript_34092:218-577(+)
MEGNVKDYQMTAWLMAICLNGMTDEETAALTESMVQSGVVMDWSNPSLPNSNNNNAATASQQQQQQQRDRALGPSPRDQNIAQEFPPASATSPHSRRIALRQTHVAETRAGFSLLPGPR